MELQSISGDTDVHELTSDGLDLWFRRASTAWLQRNRLLVFIPMLLLAIHTKLQMDYMAKYGFAAMLNEMGGCVLYVHHWTDDVLPVLLDIYIPMSFLLLSVYCMSCLSNSIPGVELIGGKSETQFFRRLAWLASRTIMPGVFAVVMSAVMIWETELMQENWPILFTDYFRLLLGAAVVSLPLSGLFARIIAIVAVRMHGADPVRKYLTIMLLLLPFLIPMVLDTATGHRVTLGLVQSFGIYLAWTVMLAGLTVSWNTKVPTGFAEQLDRLQSRS